MYYHNLKKKMTTQKLSNILDNIYSGTLLRSDLIDFISFMFKKLNPDKICNINTIEKLFIVEQLLQIVNLMLDDTKKVLADKNITLEISEDAKKFLLEKGTDIKYGARPLRRAIQRYLEDELSDMILRSELLNGDTIVVSSEENNLKFNVRK